MSVTFNTSTINQIMVYVIPGIIVILASNFFNLRSVTVDAKTILLSIIISYFINSVKIVIYGIKINSIEISILIALSMYMFENINILKDLKYSIYKKVKWEENRQKNFLDKIADSQGAYIDIYHKELNFIITGTLLEAGLVKNGKQELLIQDYAITDINKTYTMDKNNKYIFDTRNSKDGENYIIVTISEKDIIALYRNKSK